MYCKINGLTAILAFVLDISIPINIENTVLFIALFLSNLLTVVSCLVWID